MKSGAAGKIVTFYSYKGGTGRSMALANTAWVLASNGKRVLVIDWDLEAPGLHRFFHPFMADKDLTESVGVIDFVVNFAVEVLTPLGGSAEDLPNDWYVSHANILRYAFSLEWDAFPKPGTIDFVPAGKQGPTYSKLVNAFNWENFYERLGGGRFLEAAKERMKSEYDYILIDSRTGVSDTSGICTVQLPDLLVICFTLNSQSIEGAAAVAESVDAQRRTNAQEPGIRIFPVPTRVEKFEKDKLELAREIAKGKFERYLWHIDPELQSLYWGHVEVFYEPFYAYEEILATFGDRPFQTNSLLASIERITSYLTERSVTQLAPVSEYERQRVLAQYARQRKIPVPAAVSSANQFLFYLSYARSDLNEYLAKFYVDLSAEVRRRMNLPAEPVGFFDSVVAASGEQWPELADYAIQKSRVFVPIYSPGYFRSENCGKEFQYFLERVNAQPDARPQGQEPRPRILPVIWTPPSPPLWKTAYEFQRAEDSLPQVYGEQGLYHMMKDGRFEEDYQKFIERLAETLISSAEAGTLPELPNFYSLKNVPSAFGDIASLEVVMRGWSGLLQRFQKEANTGEFHWTDNEGDVGFLKDVDALNALIEPFLLSPSSFVDPPVGIPEITNYAEALLKQVGGAAYVGEYSIPYHGFSASPYPYIHFEVDFVDSASAVLRLICNIAELASVKKQPIPGPFEALMLNVVTSAVDFLLEARIEDRSGVRWSGFGKQVETAGKFANLFFTNCAALALHKALNAPLVKGWISEDKRQQIDRLLPDVVSWAAGQYDPAVKGFWMDEARTQAQTMGVLYALELIYILGDPLAEELRANCAEALSLVTEKMDDPSGASALQRDFFHSLPLPRGPGITFYDDRRYIGAFLSLFTLAKSRDPHLLSDNFMHAREVLFKGVSDEWIDEPTNLWDDGRPLICFSQDALLGLVNYTLW